MPRLTTSSSHDVTNEQDPDRRPARYESGRRARRGRDLTGWRRWAPHLPRRRWSRAVSVLIIIALIPVAWSVGDALTRPGGGSFTARLAEWARDHYLGPVITFGEWLSYQSPKVGGTPSFALTGPSVPANGNAQAGKAQAGKAQAGNAAASTRKKSVSYAAPPRLASMAGKPLPGEGVWRVLGTVGGKPAMYGTYLRPSKIYSSYVAGIVSMNENLLRFELRPGTEDPGPGHWGEPPYIPSGTRRGLLATFNSGFRINVSGGGFYLNGHTDGRLTPGIASEVFYRNGRMTIGVWDRTVHMTSSVLGVRQNLHLIVSQGRVPAAVNYNVESSWGATLGGGYYVWRSGIGVTRNGRVIFVYGPALNVRELADLLQRAGAVTAMQLDINPAWMSFEYYLRDESAQPRPVNLLPDQQEPADRYYFPNSRDFTAVYAR